MKSRLIPNSNDTTNSDVTTPTRTRNCHRESRGARPKRLDSSGPQISSLGRWLFARAFLQRPLDAVSRPPADRFFGSARGRKFRRTFVLVGSVRRLSDVRVRSGGLSPRSDLLRSVSRHGFLGLLLFGRPVFFELGFLLVVAVGAVYARILLQGWNLNVGRLR